MKWIDAKKDHPKEGMEVIGYWEDVVTHAIQVGACYYIADKWFWSLSGTGFPRDVVGWMPLSKFGDFASQDDDSIDCEGWIRPGDCMPEEGQHVVIRWPDSYEKKEDIGWYHLGRWWKDDVITEIPKECVVGWLPIPGRYKFRSIENEGETDSGDTGASGEGVDHPSHSQDGGVEAIDIMEGWIIPEINPEEGQYVVINRLKGYSSTAIIGWYRTGRWWEKNGRAISSEDVQGWLPLPKLDRFRGIKAEADSGKKTGTSGDNVNHPSHYRAGDYECIDVMLAVKGLEKVKNWCECNTFKYIWRDDKKNGLEDMEKARWYLDKYMELSRLIEEGE